MDARLQQIKEQFLGNLQLTIRGVRGRVLTLSEYRIVEEENVTKFVFNPIGNATCTITVTQIKDTFQFQMDARIPRGVGDPTAFVPENAVDLTLGPVNPERMLASHHDCPWWMLPSHPNSFEEILPRTQSLLVQYKDRHLHFLPLCGDDFRSEFFAGRLSLTSDCCGLQALTGYFLSVSFADTPTKAFEQNYKACRETGALRVPLRTERVFPAILEGFGFCSWDAFYHNISSEKFLAKLDELKEKQIPIQWVIIDDGWMQMNGQLIQSFTEDPKKFPEGLKAFISKVKNEYKIPYVGVWHTFNCYWAGIEYGSELYEEQKGNLFRTPADFYLPGPDEEHVFRFFDAWHTYLQDCGVDFVKVDNQSSNAGFLIGNIPTIEFTRICHQGLERSVNKHFGGTIINCMGMDMENVLSRPSTAVSRNSDDFFPRRERGFVKHLTQNAYNALWHGQVHYCDFDMWWSDHESAVQSGVLRAVSGSPIYVSDEVGHSKLETIIPTIDKYGNILRCDNPAMPTEDCIYIDCVEAKKHLKLWNRSKDAYVAAVFNVCAEEVSDELSLATIPEMPGGEYMAYEYFTHTWLKVTKNSRIPETLGADDVRMWCFYPIKGTGNEAYIEMGDLSKYASVASKEKVKKLIKEL